MISNKAEAEAWVAAERTRFGCVPRGDAFLRLEAIGEAAILAAAQGDRKRVAELTAAQQVLAPYA